MWLGRNQDRLFIRYAIYVKYSSYAAFMPQSPPSRKLHLAVPVLQQMRRSCRLWFWDIAHALLEMHIADMVAVRLVVSIHGWWCIVAHDAVSRDGELLVERDAGVDEESDEGNTVMQLSVKLSWWCKAE